MSLIALVVPAHISLAPPMPFRMVAKTPILSAPSRSLGDCQEERLRLTRGCEHESDPSRPFAYVDPAVWYATRPESRVARPQPVPLVADLDNVFALKDEEPLVLIAM